MSTSAVKKHSPGRILVVDDEKAPRDAIVRILELLQFEVYSADSAESALRQVRNIDLDVILLDIQMKEVDGFEIFSRIAALKVSASVVFLTGNGTLQYAIRAMNLGAYDFIEKPVQDLELFDRKLLRAVEKKRYTDLEKRYTQKLEEDVNEKTRVIKQYTNKIESEAVSIIASLQVALERKDSLTAGHTTRVTEFAHKIGQELSLTKAELQALVRGAQLHDIGKLVIDLRCIQKTTSLTEDEWTVIRTHPAVGADILEPLSFLQVEQEIVRSHHEKLDGTGYPAGKKSAEISFLARIVTVADSYDAMISQRSYKSSRRAIDAISELRRCTGTQFDGCVVDAAVRVLRNEGVIGPND